MSNITARVIADSISPQNKRITTLELVYPRFIHAEIMTHGLLSKNSASSRAIPAAKKRASVLLNPAIPLKWTKEHSGMQGYEYFDGIDSGKLSEYWLHLRDVAVKAQADLSDMGVSKQIANRLLEPFEMHTCIVTATDYENLTALRAHPQAEIHFQDLAYKIIDALNASEPKSLDWGEWHTPFADNITDVECMEAFPYNYFETPFEMQKVYHNDIARHILAIKIMVSTARCARASYNNHEQPKTIYDDVYMFRKLVENGHMSPTQHQAMSYEFTAGQYDGWLQHRKMLTGERRTDDRIVKKFYKA